jgi:hypothetical protein
MYVLFDTAIQSIQVRGDVGVVVQSFKDLRETHIIEPSAMSVEVAIEPDGAKAIDFVSSRCRVVCARIPVLAFVHGATVFMEDMTNASVLAKRLGSLSDLNSNNNNNHSRVSFRDIKGATPNVHTTLPSSSSRTVGGESDVNDSNQAPEHSCECMRYLIVNHTNQRLWYGQHATQEELSIEAACKVSYSWCVVNNAKSNQQQHPNAQDRTNSMRFALDNAARQTGRGATGAGT